MNETVHATTPVGPAAPRTSVGESASGQGRVRGERVGHVPDPVAELEDAAEELTFAESEAVEKRLSQRKLKTGAHESSIRLEQIERVRQYLRDVPDLERSEQVREFAASVLGDDAQSPGSLRERARQFSEDETHQFLALSFAREQAVEQGAGDDVLANLDAAIEGLRAEAGPTIQAGLNVSAVAGEFAGSEPGRIAGLRGLYRDVALDCADIAAAYERVVADHPGKDFDEALRFLLKALGADLAAGTASIGKPRLRQLMDDMYQLKSLNSVHEQCVDLLRRVHRNFGAELAESAPRDLLGELLTARDRAWQGADAFAGLPSKMGVRGDQAGIYLLQGFKDLVRFVPQKAFGDDAAMRDRVMIAVQQALDVAIDNEEYDD